MQNFAFPYFSRDIAEFWRRWHISLSTWFRDYLYIPLGGSKGGTWMKIRNIIIIFIVSGLWHGANWTFIAWGFLNALLFLPLLILNTNRRNLDNPSPGKIFSSFKELVQILTTFLLTLIAWIFFRSETIMDALKYIKGLFSVSLFTVPEVLNNSMIRLLMFIGILIAVEWLQRSKQHALELNNNKFPRVLRWFFYYTIIFLIIIYGGEPARLYIFSILIQYEEVYCQVIVFFNSVSYEYPDRNVRQEKYLQVKSDYVRNNKDQIELLILGSSQINKGVNPLGLDYITAPLANDGATLNIDYLLFQKYFSTLPNLKLVIFELSYHSLEDRKGHDWNKNHLFYNFYGVNNYGKAPPLSEHFLLSSNPKLYLMRYFTPLSKQEDSKYNEVGFILNSTSRFGKV